jgi:colanic acid/amylovoran biosynthesis glycosyltransferase
MTNSKLTIALLSPDQNPTSSTFIAAHRRFLAGNILYFYKNWCPTFLENKGVVASLPRLAWYFLKHKLGNPLTFRQQALSYAFSKQPIDVVFAEYGIVGAQVLPVCKQLNLPLVVIFHGGDAHEKATTERLATEYRALFAYAHKIIAVSLFMKKTLQSMGCPESKLVWSPCAPNDCFFAIEPKPVGKTFMAVGRFTAKKSPITTIRAFSEVLKAHPDARLNFGGDGDLMAECKQLVQELGIAHAVDLMGNISPDRVIELFSTASAFVQHSITAPDGDSEGTPVAVMEASAACLPVISTFHAGIPDVVLDKKTGYLVAEHDTQAMTQAMIAVLDNPKKAREMGNAGRAFVQSNFTMHHHIEAINQALLSAVK